MDILTIVNTIAIFLIYMYDILKDVRKEKSQLIYGFGINYDWAEYFKRLGMIDDISGMGFPYIMIENNSFADAYNVKLIVDGKTLMNTLFHWLMKKNTLEF